MLIRAKIDNKLRFDQHEEQLSEGPEQHLSLEEQFVLSHGMQALFTI